MVSIRAALPLAALLVASLTACPPPTTAGDGGPAAEGGACVLERPGSLEAIGATPAIFLEGLDDDDASLALLERDLADYLGRVWGADVTITRGSPDTDGAYLHFVAGEAARALASDLPDDGHVLRRDGDRLLVAGADVHQLTYGAFELLVQMGARFFHPLDEIVPAWGEPVWPTALDEIRRSPFRVRALHAHTLHPTEYFRPLLEPGADNLARAKQLIDWLAKTGQNHLQFFLLSTLDYDALGEHLTELIAYAHARGVTVGAVAALFDDGVLQNQWTVVQDPDGGFEQMESSIDAIMAVPFDHLDLSMGEFFAGDPAALVAWLDHATAYGNDVWGIDVGIQNHVGDYPELYVTYEGETRYFYFLPGECDERLIQNVHTVFFFDLYREWAMYEHDNFHGHRAYILDELGERPVRYFPESAYWVSADIDVPVFLADYINARWIDIHGLVTDIEAQGLPMLDGHTLYSSGHEWSYWAVDYLTARMLWQPTAPRQDAIGHLAGGFSGCAAEVETALTSFIDLQSDYLFDRKLVPYASAEDIHDDLGYAADIDTHPPRVSFEAVRAMSDEERQDFARTVLDPLADVSDQMEALLPPLVAACEQADDALDSWCAELIDSIEVTQLKLLHSELLYRTLLDALSGEDDRATFALAQAAREAAAAVIERRKAGYRFPDDELVTTWENPTRYKFNLLRQAHTQCLWTRQEQQLTYLIENGAPQTPFELPTCQD